MLFICTDRPSLSLCCTYLYLHTISYSSRLESSMCSAVALLVRPDVINPGPKHRNRRPRICLRCPGSTLQDIPYSCTFTSTMSSDLRQTVLRSNAREQHTDDAASDEDWVNVVRAFALKTGWSSSPRLAANRSVSPSVSHRQITRTHHYHCYYCISQKYPRSFTSSAE
jgi:hypothetical protein